MEQTKHESMIISEGIGNLNVSDQSLSQRNHRFLTGKLIIAVPFLEDQQFYQSVIYICGHDQTGAMGLVLNKPLESINFQDLLKQMSIDHDEAADLPPIHYGGPIEVGRGFVLHTTDFMNDSTVFIHEDFALTATLDILRSICSDKGPKKSILALGYAGWTSGQLEKEIHNNQWFIADATPDLVFHGNMNDIWKLAYNSIGVDPSILSFEYGNA